MDKDIIRDSFDPEKLNNLKIGQSYKISGFGKFTRVPGGYIYQNWGSEEGGVCCFIPYSEEFNDQDANDQKSEWIRRKQNEFKNV